MYNIFQMCQAQLVYYFFGNDSKRLRAYNIYIDIIQRIVHNIVESYSFSFFFLSCWLIMYVVY